MTSQEQLVKLGRVVIDTPETMNLLGLLMSGLLATKLSDERIFSRVSGITGDILVRAGDMSVTLRMNGGGVTIIRGESERPLARVAGTMIALLDVVVKGRMLWPLLTGKLRIGGNPFILLKMLPMIRT